MRKLRGAFLDDDIFMHQIIRDLSKLSHLIEVDKFYCDSNQFLMEHRELDVDLFFLDIIMPDTDGFTIAKQIQGKPFVFVTSINDSLLFKRALALNPIDILTKPIDSKRFNYVIEKAYSLISNSHENSKHGIFHAEGIKGKTIINFEDIILAIATEKDRRNKKIYLRNGDVYILKKCNFNTLLNASKTLTQVNKGELISLNVVKNIEYDVITLNISQKDCPRQVTLSPKYAHDFLRKLKGR